MLDRPAFVPGASSGPRLPEGGGAFFAAKAGAAPGRGEGLPPPGRGPVQPGLNRNGGQPVRRMLAVCRGDRGGGGQRREDDPLHHRGRQRGGVLLGDPGGMGPGSLPAGPVSPGGPVLGPAPVRGGVRPWDPEYLPGFGAVWEEAGGHLAVRRRGDSDRPL